MFYSLASRPAQQRTSTFAANRSLDKFLNDTLSAVAGTRAAPAATIEDGESAYSLQLDVPGLAREQLEIGIEADVLRINSKADAPRVVKAAYRFPLEIDASASSAKLEHGVLSLSLAKKIPVSQVSQLVIN